MYGDLLKLPVSRIAGRLAYCPCPCLSGPVYPPKQIGTLGDFQLSGYGVGPLLLFTDFFILLFVVVR